MTPLKVCIVGSGNWGSVIARILGENVDLHPGFFPTVSMWVYEEMVNGRKLTEIINTEHENPKYLPGYKIPPNILAIPDLAEAVRNADLLVFVIPHQFLEKTCAVMKPHVKPSAAAISLIKGLKETPDTVELISDSVRSVLGIHVSVLMGANLANEVADGKFCETTIGCDSAELGPVWKDLFHTKSFRVSVVADDFTVELCGALKNIVGLGAGFVDGLGLGDNTQAAIIRIGLLEMIRFCKHFYPASREETFLESCGIGDLIATCYGGRNRKVAKAFVTTGKSIEVLEAELLNGQKLQGPSTSRQTHAVLAAMNMTASFPLMTAVYRICHEGAPPSILIESLKASI